MKTLLFFFSFTTLVLSAAGAHGVSEEQIIRKITTFMPKVLGPKLRPYAVLRNFLLSATCLNVKNLAKKLEAVYGYRKGEITEGKWPDYVPYCFSRCFLELLQSGFDPDAFSNWKEVANAIAFYCPPKGHTLGIADIKTYYSIRYVGQGVPETRFLFCKKRARDIFTEDGILKKEKESQLKRCRAFAKYYGDLRMQGVLRTKTLLGED